MNYYKKDNKVYGFNDLQVKRGIGEEFTPITEAEADELRKPTFTDEELAKQQIAEHEAYLKSTDWITAKYNDEVTILGSISKADFIAKYQDVYNARQNARNEINRLEEELKGL